MPIVGVTTSTSGGKEAAKASEWALSGGGQSLLDAVRRAIARIEVRGPGGKIISRGTGTLITESLVVTAMHVVANRQSDTLQPAPGDIVLIFPHGEVGAAIVEDAWDRREDWALLKCGDSIPARPVPLGEAPTDRERWEAFGFPDANPDGMVFEGHVADTNAAYQGQHAHQLYSLQAAGGMGAPVPGLSGGPVLAEGALFGVMRSSLMHERRNVAGTLYACPIGRVVERLGDRLPTPDPYRGLPGLPQRDLPATPFRYLSFYGPEHAEVFFGRGAEIRHVFEQLVAEPDAAPPVILYYGQSGVGKSSLLAAGLIPRLHWSHEVVYVRRTQRGATTDIRSALGGGWRAMEARVGRPVAVIIDQVEEAYAQAPESADREVAELCRWLADQFKDADKRPAGRLILSFRKEWLAELRTALETANVPFCGEFLQRLTREGVTEVVRGLTATQRLRRTYKLTVESGLEQTIADDMLADKDAPVAPTLQIVMTRLWRRATRDGAAPELTRAIYRELQADGLLLGDFLERQLERVAAARPDDIATGLVLDILATHTTGLGTARAIEPDELERRYRHIDPAQYRELLAELGRASLLITTADGDTRLTHDTIAPHVRQRFDESVLPGQRATRILAQRAQDWVDPENEGAPLGSHDLGDVQSGLAGRPALSDAEHRLLEESRRMARRRRNAGVLVRLVLALLVVASASLGVWALEESREAIDKSQEAAASAMVARVEAANALASTAKAEHLKVVAESQKSSAESSEREAKAQATLALAQQTGLEMDALVDAVQLYDGSKHQGGATPMVKRALHDAFAAAQRSRRLTRLSDEPYSITATDELVGVATRGGQLHLLPLRPHRKAIPPITLGAKPLVAFTQHGHRLVALTGLQPGHDEALVTLWNIDPPRPLTQVKAKLTRHQREDLDRLLPLWVGHAPKHLVVPTADGATLIESETGRTVTPLPGMSHRFVNDGAQVAAVVGAPSPRGPTVALHLWNTETGELQRRGPQHSIAKTVGEALCSSQPPSLRRGVEAPCRSALTQWRHVPLYDGEHVLSAARLSADHGGDELGVVWEGKTGKPTRWAACKGAQLELVWTTQASLLYRCHPPHKPPGWGEIVAMTYDTEEVAQTLLSEAFVGHVYYVTDGTVLSRDLTGDELQLRRWDGTQLASASVPVERRVVATNTPSADSLVYADSSGWIRVIQSGNFGAPATFWSSAHDPVFSRKEMRAVSFTNAGVVLWDTLTWRPLRTLLQPEKPEEAMAVFLANTDIVTAGAGLPVQLWSGITGELKSTLSSESDTRLAMVNEGLVTWPTAPDAPCVHWKPNPLDGHTLRAKVDYDCTGATDDGPPMPSFAAARKRVEGERSVCGLGQLLHIAPSPLGQDSCRIYRKGGAPSW